MAKVPLTAALRIEYEKLFTTCAIRPAKAAEIETLVNRLIGNRARYEAVAQKTGVPWQVVAVIHNMESSQSFTRHLHNGDPLTARTVQVPAGRPKTGSPPFTWEASCGDALGMKDLGSVNWTLADTLYQLEGYNGWGYRLHHQHVLSPYLWSGSNHYTSGKYVKDGVWSDTAVSGQMGAAVLLRRLAEKGLFGFADQPLPQVDAGPVVSRYRATKPTAEDEIAKAILLQTWLNTFPGLFVKPDGWAGQNTSNAYRVVTGRYLPGDPREG